METGQAIRINAPAKVNLVLRVLERRPDGYHNLWSLMQTVALEDELFIRLRPDRPGIQVQCDEATLPTDARNLVFRAASLVLEQAGRLADRAPGLELRIAKRIPVSAGLGGGSSDAAATIMAVTTLLGLGWSQREMAKAAESLGSDVPFFFSAPAALVRGRGEDVKAVTITGQRWAVLVNPGFPIETRWAYEQLSVTRPTVRSLSNSLRRIGEAAAVSWDEIVPLMENDFEAALVPTHAILGRIKQALLAAGAEAALLSGSGATVFGIFHDEAAAVRAREAMSRSGWHAFAVPTCAEPLACRTDRVSRPASVG